MGIKAILLSNCVGGIFAIPYKFKQKPQNAT